MVISGRVSQAYCQPVFKFTEAVTSILSFTYNEEEFNFDVSDSYIPFENQDDPEIYYYLIETELDEPLQRIIYNQEMNYFTIKMQQLLNFN